MILNQLIGLIETYACRTSKDLICKKEKINRDNIIKQYKNWKYEKSWLDDKRKHKRT